MPNRLLLADGDPKSLRVLDVSLRNAGFEVSTAATGVAAWEAIEKDAPDVIIADADLPELDGLGLCLRVRQSAPDRAVPFIFLAADKSVDARIRGLQAGADEYLFKPAYVNEVIARVRTLVQRRERDKLATGSGPAESFSGKLSDITVVDLLDLVAGNRRSGLIHLHGPRGSAATVYFRQGVVVDAEVGRLSGADAIGRLFSWTEGTFEIEWKNIRRPDAIGRPTADLVLDGMKRLDDKNRLAAQHPDVNGVYEVNYRVLAERLAEIPDEVNSILRLFDGSRRLAHVVEDSQLPDLEAMTVVARLREEGIIFEVRSDRGPEPSGPVPVAGSTDTTSGRTGASGSERRGGRPGSGLVEQSFAERMQADARASAAGASALTPPPPPPPRPALQASSPPSVSKTDRGFPQIDPSPPVAEVANETSIDDEMAAVGLALAAGDGQNDAAPGAGGVDDNVIPFPTDDRASAPSRAPTESPEDAPSSSGDSEEMSPAELAALFGSDPGEPAPEPVAESGPSSAENAVPKQPVSMLQTQRGFGLLPPPPPAADDDVSESGDVPASGAPAPETLEAKSAPVRLSAPHDVDVAAPLVERSLGEPRASTGSGRVVAAGAANDATAPFLDRDLSKGEALDELGMPGRGRLLKILGAALVVGAVAAVGAASFHRLSKQRTGAPVIASVEPGKPMSAEPAAGIPKAEVSAPPPSVPLAPSAPSASPTAGSTKAAAKNMEKLPESGAEKSIEKPAVTKSADKSAEKNADKKTEEAAEKPAVAVNEKAAEATKTGKPEAKPSLRTPADAVAAPRAAVPDAFRQQMVECRALFTHNRFREAGVACGAALESNPRSPDALTMLAHVELNRGHLGRAYELAQKAIAIYPDQPDAYVIIGGVHQDSGRNDQAKAAYHRYLQLSPHGRYAEELRSIVGSL